MMTLGPLAGCVTTACPPHWFAAQLIATGSLFDEFDVGVTV